MNKVEYIRPCRSARKRMYKNFKNDHFVLLDQVDYYKNKIDYILSTSCLKYWPGCQQEKDLLHLRIMLDNVQNLNPVYEQDEIKSILRRCDYIKELYAKYF